MFSIGTAAPAPPPPPETISLGEGIPEIEVGDIPQIEAEGDNATRLMLRVAKFRKDPEANGLETKEGWGTYAAKRLPFYAHGLFNQAQAVKDAWVNIDSNERMPEENLDNLARVIVDQELRDQEESQKGLLQKGGDLATAIPGMGIEMAATWGAATAAKQGAIQGAKGLAKFVLPKVAKTAITTATAKLAERAAVKAAARAGGVVATSAIATHLNPARLAQGTAERMLPSMVGDRLVKGESLGDAYFNASTSGTIETLTEQLGGGVIGSVLKKAGGTKVAGKAVEMLMEMPGAKVAKAVKESTAKWLAGRAGLQMPEALKVLADKAKFHSLFGEMMEERYGEGMKAVSDQVMGTNIGDENMGVTGNLALAAYKKLKGEHGAAADHFISALGQLAVETIGIGGVKAGMRGAGVAWKAGGLDYDHSEEYASLWATANPEAAELLLKRDPKTLSRMFFAKDLGLPATMGLPKREEFAGWVKDAVAAQKAQAQPQAQAAPPANQQDSAPAAPIAPEPDVVPYQETTVTDPDGKSYVEYTNEDGELIRTPVVADQSPPIGTAAVPEVASPPPAVPVERAPRKMPGGELKGRGIKSSTRDDLQEFGWSLDEINNMTPEEAERKASEGQRLDEEDLDYLESSNAATDRTPALQASAQELQAAYARKAPKAEIDALKQKHSELVSEQKPVKPYEALPEFTSDEAAIDALSSTQGSQENPKASYWQLPRNVAKGSEVGLRLDIPSYVKKNQWIVTVHGKREGVSGGAGKLIGYDSHAAVDDAVFVVPGKGSLKIAAGAAKGTIATIEGKWSPQDDASAKAEAEIAIAESKKPGGQWVQVGMDPERHGYFYSRHDMRPVLGAERVVQVGPLVLAKNPNFGDAASPEMMYASEGEAAPAKAPRPKSWKKGSDLNQKRAFLRSLGPGGKELDKALLDEEVEAIGPQGAGVVAELYGKLKYLDPHLKTLVDIGKNAQGGYTEGFALVSELVGRETALLWGLLNSAFSAQNAVKKHSVAGLDLALRLKAFLDDPKNEGKNPTAEQAKEMFYETVAAVRAGNVATKSVHLPKSIKVIMQGFAATYYELRNKSSSSVEHAVGKVPWFGLSSQGDPRGVVLDTYMARLLTPEVVGFKYVEGMQKAIEDEDGNITGYQTLSEAQQLKEAQKKWLSNDNNYIAYSARVRKLANKLNIKAGVAQEMIWSAVYGIIGLKNAGVKNAVEELKHEDVRAAWDLMSLILENKDVKQVLRTHGVGDAALTRLRAEADKITAAHRPVGLTGKTGARIPRGFKKFAKAIAPTGPTEGSEVAKRYRGEGGREFVAITLSASTSSIEGLKTLTDAARSGNDKAAIETLNGIARDSLEHLLGGIDDVEVSYDSNFGVYMGEGEPSLGVSISFGEKNRPFVLAALARFAENFNQQEVHVRREVDDFEGRTDYGDGSYSTPVHHVVLNPKQELTIDEIKKIMETSGLKGLTVNKRYLEAYYVGDVEDAAAIAEWERQFAGVVQSLTGRIKTDHSTVARLWVYGDTTGSIPYSSIQGDIRPSKTGAVKTVARVAGRRLGRKVVGSEQAKEITPEQDALQTKIGDYYEAAPDDDLDNENVRRAYEEAAKEIKEQFLDLPIKVEAWVEKDGKEWKAKGGEPYDSSNAMRADLLERNRMTFFATVPDQFGPEGVTYDNHPLLQDSGLKDANGYPLLYNDLLRVVHDYYAHGLTETQFGPKGEEAAWRNHMAATKSPWAKWAITMETRGQNSWVNFRTGLDRSIPTKKRPFARQKVALLPIRYSLTGDKNIDKGMREFINSLSPEARLGSFKEDSVEKLESHSASMPSSSRAVTPPRPNPSLKSRVIRPDVDKEPETDDGARLMQAMSKKGTTVGTKTIGEFLAEGLHALMIHTKSQLTRKRPGKFIASFRNRKGEATSPPFHVALIRDVDGHINFHELGHAMSAMFENVNNAKYSEWMEFWKDKLTELSYKGLSSNPGSIEEGVAEMMRLYMNFPEQLADMTVDVSGGKQKSLLDGFNELLAGIGVPEVAAIRDTQRLFQAHRAKPLTEQYKILKRDKGYAKSVSSKKAVEKGRDFLTAIFSKTVTVQSMLKDAMTELSGLEQSGMGNVTAMLKLMPVVSRAFGVKEGQRKKLKASLAAARKILKDIANKGGDIESSYNNIARTGLEVQRVMEGTGGVRIFASDISPEILFEMSANGLPVPGSASGDVAEVDKFGKQVSGLPAKGEWVYLTHPETGEQIKHYGEIKSDVGEEAWPDFENYGQLKTIDARYRAREEAQEAWDDADEKIGKRPETYKYPEHFTHSIDEIRDAISEYERANPKFVKSYADVETLMDAMLVISVIAGETPIDEAVRMKNAYDHYWPLGRIMRGTSGGDASMKKNEINYGIERDRGGSELPFRSLDEVVFGRVNKALTAYNYGRMMDASTVFSREMAKLTPEFRNKVKWMQVFVPLAPDMDMTRVKPEQHRQILADHLNDLEAKKNGYRNKEEMERAEPGSLLEPADIDLRGAGDVVLFNETAPRMAQVIARKVQGKMQYHYVSDPGVLEILSSGGSLAQSFPRVAAITGILGAMTKPLSRVITRSMPFAFFNTFYRDPKTAMTTGEGKGALVPLYYSYLALKAIIHGRTGKQTDAEKEATSEVWAMWGQASSPMNAFGLDATRRSFKAMMQEGWRRDGDGRKISYSPTDVGWPKVLQSSVGAAASFLLKPIDIANWASGGWWLSPKGEAVTRMGAYIDARNRGLTQEQSLMAADNSTANFNQRSDNPLFQMADKQAMFFNARMQVRWQFYRQLLHPDPSVRGAAYLKMMYSGALHAMILPAVVLGLKAVGDDEFDKWLEAWLKQEDERTDSDKARIGSIPLRNGLQFKIPFDDGPASMFDSVAFNASLSWLAGAKSRGETIEQAAAGMYARLMSFTGPGLSQLINPVVRTAIESEINFEFYNNRRIIPDGIASIYEKKQQTTPSTPETWNQLAEWLDTYGIEASPMKIRHIVNGIGLKYVDQVAAWNDKKSPGELGNFPMLGQLFTRTPRGFSSQPVLSLSEMDAKFDSAKKNLEKAAEGGDRERAEEASRMMISLQGYKAWHNTVMRQWKVAKKFRDAGNVDQAMAMEKLMTETARRGLKQAALQEAEVQRRLELKRQGS